MNENEELKQSLARTQEESRVEIISSSTQNVSGNETDTEILLQRSPRNYLSSSPDVVAFDAFRNKPFHTPQVSTGVVPNNDWGSVNDLGKT